MNQTSNHPLTLEQISNCFHECFFNKYQVVLKGGFDEPFYKTHQIVNGKHQAAEIQFREDFIRSALHEISHWCVAGLERRSIDDYGYWYEPDGRNFDQQIEFFNVEVTPQAYESILCDAAQIEFQVSVDNLDVDISDLEVHIENFKKCVFEKKEQILNTNGHKRVLLLANRLQLETQIR